jgi:hypothetical protein
MQPSHANKVTQFELFMGFPTLPRGVPKCGGPKVPMVVAVHPVQELPKSANRAAARWGELRNWDISTNPQHRDKNAEEDRCRSRAQFDSEAEARPAHFTGALQNDLVACFQVEPILAAQAQRPAAVRREDPSGRPMLSEGRARQRPLPLPRWIVDGTEDQGRPGANCRGAAWALA